MNRFAYVRPLLEAMIRDGNSAGYIVTAFNAAGVRTVSGRAGARWSNSTVQTACRELDLPAPKFGG